MLGKVSEKLPFAMLYRITPAYAGKSYRIQLILHMLRDHPRLCGEKVIPSRACTCIEGSPPPMRGKGIFFRSISALSRITPAYAGKSVPS